MGLSLADVQLTPDQLDLYIDLGPYANSSYYVVQVKFLSGLWEQWFWLMPLLHR